MDVNNKNNTSKSVQPFQHPIPYACQTLLVAKMKIVHSTKTQPGRELSRLLGELQWGFKVIF